MELCTYLLGLILSPLLVTEVIQVNTLKKHFVLGGAIWGH